MTSSSDNTGKNDIEFLSGGGEMGQRIRDYDWGNTSIGPVSGWPSGLRTIVRIMLTSPQPIWIGWGKDLVKMYNDPYKAIVGGKHPWALGQPASEVWRDIWTEAGPRLQKVISQNEGTYDESLLLIMERYGYQEETYYTFSYSPVPDDEGKIGGIFCANTDNTHRIIGERQTNLLRELSSKTISIKTLEGLYAKMEEALQTNLADLPFALLYMLQGKEPECMLELKVCSGIPKGHRAAPQSVAPQDQSSWPFQHILQSTSPLHLREINATGEYFPVGVWNKAPQEAIAVSFALAGNTTKQGLLIIGLNPYRLYNAGYEGFINLLTSQMESILNNAFVQEEERKRAEALAEIDKAKTVFFSNVSHEFRTPLTLMLGPVEDVLNDPLTLPQHKEKMTIAHRNSLRLLKLVNSLLDFSKIEAGRLQASYLLTDIAQFTADLASSFTSAMEKAGLAFHLYCEPVAQPVYVDRTMWERIVFNLLSNALKYTFEGAITVTVRPQGSFFELIVQDTGTGIAPEELPKLFSRFHRIENVKGRTHEGTGIGLAMVQELVAMHGGTVKAESEPGKGTAFCVQLPVGKDHLPVGSTLQEEDKRITLNALPDLEEEMTGLNLTAHTETPHSPASETRQDTILVADDNQDMRHYILRLLSPYYHVITATDGFDALEKLEKETPTLLLSDIMMPNMDGLTLLNRVRNNPQLSTLPVVLISARAGEEATIEGIQAGADDYLVKPFSANELLARVQSNLNMARLRKQAEEVVRMERQRLEQLLTNAPASVAIFTGANLRIEFANPMYCKLFGMNRDIVGKSLLEVVPDITAELLDIIRKVAFEGERFTSGELPVTLDWDGLGHSYTKYFDMVYEPLIVENKPDGFICFAFEITAQVTARLSIQESEEKYKGLFTTMDQGFCIVEMLLNEHQEPYDYRFLEVNPIFEAQTGLVNAAGRTARELNPALESKWFEMYGKVALSGQPIRFTEGSKAMGRWFDVYAFRLGNASGLRVAILFTDVTEQKLAQETLRLKNEQLIRINNDLDNFIYTASHDLKAPVSNLEGLFHALLDEIKVTDSVKELTLHIETSFLRFKSTISELADITKVQKGDFEDVELISITDLLHDIDATIEGQIKKKGAEIRYQLGVEKIRFSRKNLRSILYNLISNSVKYSSPDRTPVITISTAREEGVVVLTVADNGLGISAVHQGKLFQMFKRFHNHVEGSGIGLYIVKRIIDNAGGSIEVYSEEGRGTTFKVFFGEPASAKQHEHN